MLKQVSKLYRKGDVKTWKEKKLKTRIIFDILRIQKQLKQMKYMDNFVKIIMDQKPSKRGFNLF